MDDLALLCNAIRERVEDVFGNAAQAFHLIVQANLSPAADPAYQFWHGATADLGGVLEVLHKLLVSELPASRTEKDPVSF